MSVTTTFTCDSCGVNLGSLPGMHTFTKWEEGGQREKMDLCRKCGERVTAFIQNLKREASAT